MVGHRSKRKPTGTVGFRIIFPNLRDRNFLGTLFLDPQPFGRSAFKTKSHKARDDGFPTLSFYPSRETFFFKRLERKTLFSENHPGLNLEKTPGTPSMQGTASAVRYWLHSHHNSFEPAKGRRVSSRAGLGKGNGWTPPRA